MSGGHLRGLFADGLEQAALLVDEPALGAARRGLPARACTWPAAMTW